MAAVTAPTRPARMLGRFELQRLLGRSARTMAWHAVDTSDGRALSLWLPRVQPKDAPAARAWVERVRHASRLDHPRLAQAVEVGVQDGWPYAAYDGADAGTLADRAGSPMPAATDAARWVAQALEGLAFAHDAGIAHHDLQLHAVVLDGQGNVKVMGLEAGAVAPAPAPAHAVARTMSVDPQQLGRQRDAAERDVLMAGLVLHRLLAGQPALDEPDTGAAADRLPPSGQELVRLSWNLPRPVPEPLRVIVNRATDRQPRQRFRAARTLERALQGWIDSDAQQDGGPVAQLLDRVRRAGALPAQPDAAARTARLMSMMRERTDEMAEVVLRDAALAFELLRAVNSAQVRGVQVSGNGPVLTVRRAIALVGLDGVRQAARALRPWPGPLDEASADVLRGLMDDAARAGRLAQALRPAGYDAEAVHLVALLQNLGRLVVQYHFPDEAAQIRRLMQPAPAPVPGGREEPGMTEEAASLAVLGTPMEAMGQAVARFWGLDETVLQMIRRLPLDTPVRGIDRDEDLVRASASAGNEAVDAARLGGAATATALDRVAQRYARALGTTPKGVREVLAQWL